MRSKQLVSIVGAVGVASIAIVLTISLFSRENMWVAAPIVGALAAMGVIMGFFVKGKSSD